MEAWGAVESARKLWMHRRYETLWASYPDLEIGAGPRTRRRHGDRAPWLQRGGTGQKTRFLRNEPKCNVEQIAFMWLMENELDRSRKNDKWVRFFRSERKAPERAPAALQPDRGWQPRLQRTEDGTLRSRRDLPSNDGRP